MLVRNILELTTLRRTRADNRRQGSAPETIASRTVANWSGSKTLITRSTTRMINDRMNRSYRRRWPIGHMYLRKMWNLFTKGHYPPSFSTSSFASIRIPRASTPAALQSELVSSLAWYPESSVVSDSEAVSQFSRSD
jgi:hypothetical protein